VTNWDDLRFFLAVARAGSFSAAARALKVAQPTVGRRVAALEERLGAELFVEAPTGQILSETGRLMLGQAEQMELAAIAAARIASGRDLGLRGRVTITASEWFIGSVLAPLLGPFVTRYPELELELLADVRHLSLLRREADIAIRPSRFEHAEVIERRIGYLSFGLYAADSYLAAHGAPDFERQCEGHTLIAMSEALGKVPDVTWLPEVASRARVAVRANGREPMVRMASAGLGIACLPRFLGDRAPNLRFLPTPNQGPRRELWLGGHRDSRSVPRVKATTNFLGECVGRLGVALDPR
jgi:DNA-binding transcriptional LysR family regulator